jgi:hypothetical protein
MLQIAVNKTAKTASHTSVIIQNIGKSGNIARVPEEGVNFSGSC